MIPSTYMLAAFVTPALATAGLAAMAAPILIHLLARRRFKRIRWAAMEFLLDAERRNRRRIQMEDWILMALRSLAVAAIGFLVARPFLSPTGLAAWAGARRTERVLVIDDSFSMGYASQDATSFDRAKQAARRILNTIHQESPDDTVTILRATAPDRPVVAGAYLDSRQLTDVLARVEAMSATRRSMDLPAVFNGVVDSLGRDSSILAATVYILGDFQRADWSGRSGEGGANLAEALERWAGDERPLRAVLVNLGDGDAVNAAVIGLSLPAGQVVAGTEGAVRAEIGNFSGRSLDNIGVRLAVGDRPEVTKNLPQLAERRTASIDVEAPFLRAGDEAVRVELPRDALSVDDIRFLSAAVVSAFRVLVVNGEASPDSFNDEVALLTTALRPEGEVFSGFEVLIIGETELDSANLNQFHCVVLANVFRISDPAVESLEHYVRRGGGLMLFLGDQIDADVFNTTFYRFGEGLSPVELVDVVRTTTPAHMVIADRLHPALRAVGRDEDPLGLRQVPFSTFFAAKPHTPQETDAAQPDRRPQDKPANVLAKFDDAEEHAALVERPFGAGRVLLSTSTADKEWNLWPDHPTYLPVILELASYLARTSGQSGDHWVGDAISLSVDPSTYLPEVTLRPPGFPNEPEAFITAVPDESGLGLTATWERTEDTGLYQFVLRKQDGGETVRLIAVNTDPRESDLTMADETELRKAMGNLKFEYIRGLEELATGSDEKRTEIWPLCLALAVVLLMSEQFLAWKWGRRR